MEKENLQYISLQKATEYCSYSQEYLSLLARHGKLKAVKFGRNWVTTKEWIEEYVEKVKNNNQVHQRQEKVVDNTGEDRGELLSFTEVPSEEIEVESSPSSLQGPGQDDPSPPEIRFREKVRLAILIALLFVFLVAGGVFAIRQGGNEFARWVEKGGFKSVFRETNSYVVGLNQEFDKGIIDPVRNVISQGVEGIGIVISNGADSWQEIQGRVKEINQIVDKGIISGLAGVNSAKRISMDISNGVQEVGQTGDFVLKGAVQSFKESFVQVSQDISQFSDDISQFFGEARSTVGKVTSFGVAGLNQLADVSREIPKSIAEIFQNLNQGLARQVSNIQGGLEGLTRTIVQGFKITGQGIFYGFEGVGKGVAGISQGVTKGGKTISQAGSNFGITVLQGTSNGLELLAEGVKSIGQGAKNVVSGFKNITSKLVKVVITPFQREAVVRIEKEAIPEDLEKELSRLSEEIEKLKLEGLPIREITREVTRVTQIEPIREITKETIRIDESALAEVRASLAVLDTQVFSLENKTSRGLYVPSPAPTTFFSVSGNITEGGVALSSKYISIPGGSLQGDILIGSWGRLAAGTVGQFLQTQGAGADPVWAVPAPAVAGGWTDDGATIRLTTVGDSVGIGTAAPNAKLELLATTEQLRLSYDASNRMTLTVGATGGVTFDAVGAGAGFTFSDNVTIPPSSLIFSTANPVTISATNPAADRTYTIPDFGSNDSFVGLAATQTLSSKTLTLPQINDTSSDHQYVFGVSELVADRTITLPLLTGNDDFVFEDFIQTLTNKTLTSPDINGGTADALTSLGIRSTGTGAFDLTFANTENLTAGKTFTITTGDSARTLTISADVTLDQSVATTSAVTFSSLSLTDATNQIVLDSDGANTGTLTMASLGGSRTWTLPDLTATLATLGIRTTRIFPEYPGAIISADGSNNTGEMTADVETEGNFKYNYYEWNSSQGALQDFDIYVKWQAPSTFAGFPAGTNDALIVDIATETTNNTQNKVDVTLQEDGSATTTNDTANVSTVAADWHTDQEGNAVALFDDSDTVLAGLVSGDVLIIRITLYSHSNNYARVGAITINWTQ